jgi:hypothetical protein
VAIEEGGVGGVGFRNDPRAGCERGRGPLDVARLAAIG